MSQLTKAEYNPAILEAMLAWWRRTHHKRGAAAAGGVNEETLANYLRWGAEGDARFSDFLAKWKKAEAEWIADRLAVLDAAAEAGQWPAAAWQLERHLPDEFGKKDRLGLGQDPTAGPQEHTGTFTHLSAEEAIAILGNGGPYRHEDAEANGSDDDSSTEAGADSRN